MQVLYKSTRGKGETVTASMAILKGLSEDGGLFVPTEIPKLDVPVDACVRPSCFRSKVRYSPFHPCQKFPDLFR